MTDTTPAALTPEELAVQAAASLFDGTIITESRLREAIAAAIRQHSEALTAENERLRVMADEPTTKRVWDGIQAMAALFSDPGNMPTVLEFKAAFDAAFVVDGNPYDVERIKAEWQADYAAMEGALSASLERERAMREAAQPVADAFRKHRTAMDAINAINEGGGDPGADIDALWREADAASEDIDKAMDALLAALQPQEVADGR